MDLVSCISFLCRVINFKNGDYAEFSLSGMIWGNQTAESSFSFQHEYKIVM